MDPVAVHAVLRAKGDEPLVLDTRRFQLLERIDRPFEAIVEWVTDDLDIELGSLLGEPAMLELERPRVSARVLHGVVTQAKYVTTHGQQLSAEVRVEPSLALLRYSTRRRIFSDQTVLQVLRTVTEPTFAAHGGRWEFARLSEGVRPRDYIVQYDETDLDFVLRLLAESGYCLLHGDGEEESIYVVTDRNAALPGLGMDPATPAESVPWATPFEPEGEEEATEPSVQYLGRSDAVASEGARVHARDWKTPGATRFETWVDAEAPGRVGQVWSYHPNRLDEGPAGGGPHHDDTLAWATRCFEELRAAGIDVAGASNFSDLAAGATFELQGHPHVELDQRYAVLSVVHQAEFPVVVGAESDIPPTYTNRFVAQPLGVGPIRPPTKGRPRVSGIEAAVVAGPDGDEIHTDSLGRVQVRFHWDDVSSQTCWLRVMSPWAGPGYGANFVPRVGMEVVVGFLGGDPDRPVVTGCLYTGSNLPPGALPETKTCSTIRTRSSPGGDGFNELRFEDAAGDEEVYLHAQRRHRTVVRGSQNTSVGASRSLLVGGDSARSIDGCETVRVGEANAEKKGDLKVFVTGDEARYIGGGHTVHADASVFFSADKAIAGNAQEQVRWTCTEGAVALDRMPASGTSLVMTPTTVKIESPKTIELRVGDAALVLSGRGIFAEGPVFMATPTEHAELSSPGGRLVLADREATLHGGSALESSVRLSDERLQCESSGEVGVKASLVEIHGEREARLASQSTTVQGTDDVALLSRGATTVKGQPVRIN